MGSTILAAKNNCKYNLRALYTIIQDGWN